MFFIYHDIFVFYFSQLFVVICYLFHSQHAEISIRHVFNSVDLVFFFMQSQPVLSILNVING